MKHLYRSTDNKIFAGIFGGLGEYYNTDPVLLRAGFVLLTIITGIVPCALAYIICRYLIPKKPNFANTTNTTHTTNQTTREVEFTEKAD